MVRKVLLAEQEMPGKYYNILADLPFQPDPPLHPATRAPMKPEELQAIFPAALIEQEVATASEIPIPESVKEAYLLYRPTPLIRAVALEQALKTPARIYYKYEGVSPVGSHKANTALAQAYFNKLEGTRRLVTETGAGQWGTALSFAAQKFGLECTIYMVKVSYHQKPYRRVMMQMYGGEVFPSPSERTNFGRKLLEKDPDNPGSLGIAISEAIEEALSDPQTKYSLGSVLNHVLLHQTIIGLEAREQLARINEKPDVIIGCHGGGSNFAGLAFPFLRDKINGDNLEVIAVEPVSCPTLTRGKLDYDFGDTAGMTPLLRMYTLGHDFMPPGIHAGGLRYHGAAPLVSLLKEHGLISAVALPQLEVFKGALLFTQTEGIVPAPESAHAVEMAIREAVNAREEGKQKTILFNLSGHGLLDLSAYDDYLQGKLVDEAVVAGNN